MASQHLIFRHADGMHTVDLTKALKTLSSVQCICNCGLTWGGSRVCVALHPCADYSIVLSPGHVTLPGRKSGSVSDSYPAMQVAALAMQQLEKRLVSEGISWQTNFLTARLAPQETLAGRFKVLAE